MANDAKSQHVQASEAISPPPPKRITQRSPTRINHTFSSGKAVVLCNHGGHVNHQKLANSAIYKSKLEIPSTTRSGQNVSPKEENQDPKA